MFSRGFSDSDPPMTFTNPVLTGRKKKLHKMADPTFLESQDFAPKVVGHIVSTGMNGNNCDIPNHRCHGHPAGMAVLKSVGHPHGHADESA